MCDGFVIKVPGYPDTCIPIVEILIPWPPHRPDPEHRMIEDIITMATIRQAVAHLRNEDLRGQMGHAVQAAFKVAAAQLPQGVGLGEGLLKLPQRG